MNYMRETNVWMIRKMRWMLWSFCGFIPVYRNVIYDYQGRRQAWYYKFVENNKTEEDKQKYADSKRADWGYTPRYKPTLGFSIKARKYELQTPEEKVEDTPRYNNHSGNYLHQINKLSQTEASTIYNILTEHNRIPGSFDYNYPQDFYSHDNDIDSDFYYVMGTGEKKKLDINSLSNTEVHNLRNKYRQMV